MYQHLRYASPTILHVTKQGQGFRFWYSLKILHLPNHHWQLQRSPACMFKSLQPENSYVIGEALITQYTHVHTKNNNTQGSSPYFPYLKELLLKERIRYPWEQVLSFKRSPHFEKGRNCRESLLDAVVSHCSSVSGEECYYF